jgi:biotin carboxylase
LAPAAPAPARATEPALPLTLWFNHAFSSIRNIASLLRQGVLDHGLDRPLRLLMSHSNPQFVARPLADEFFEDPRLPDDEYAQWCLDVCRSKGVDVFWPFRGARAVAARRADFEAASVALMVCASPENLDMLNDKALFYARLEGSGLGLPRHRLVSSFGDFVRAVEEISSCSARVCLKPAKSTFGLGFKIIGDAVDPLAAFLASDPVKVSFDEAKARLDVPDGRFPRLLVMELLPGPEYSLDCLAKAGRLIRVGVRKKSRLAGRPEELVQDGALEAIASRLASIFGLGAVSNIQLIDSPEGPRLLEINPRMAGGLYFSCLGGVNYPYWALRLALGAGESEIPLQRHGFFVNQYCQPFIYEAGA